MIYCFLVAMNLSIIVAIGEGNVIGKQNGLPWYLPADLKHFKTLTNGHVVIMGRKTFESIGKPLPNRVNIVLARETNYKPGGCFVARSLDEAFALPHVQNDSEAFIIGGGEIFRQTIDTVSKLYVTEVHHQFHGDIFFPVIDPAIWKEISRERGMQDEKNQYEHYFVVYERR
jgi:dihydrofolate reductase